MQVFKGELNVQMNVQTVESVESNVESRVELAIDSVIEMVRCPNCGSPAERYHAISHQRIHTQCPECDYLMTTCSQTGRVIEAYAPGIPFGKSANFKSAKSVIKAAIGTPEAAHRPHPLLNL